MINKLAFYLNLAETVQVTDTKTIVSMESLLSSFETPPSLLTPHTHSYFSEEYNTRSHDNNAQVQYELLE